MSRRRGSSAVDPGAGRSAGCRSFERNEPEPAPEQRRAVFGHAQTGNRGQHFLEDDVGAGQQRSEHEIGEPAKWGTRSGFQELVENEESAIGTQNARRLGEGKVGSGNHRKNQVQDHGVKRPRRERQCGGISDDKGNRAPFTDRTTSGPAHHCRSQIQGSHGSGGREVRYVEAASCAAHQKLFVAATFQPLQARISRLSGCRFDDQVVPGCENGVCAAL